MLTCIQEHNRMEKFSKVVDLTEQSWILGFVHPIFEEDDFFSKDSNPFIRICWLIPELQPICGDHSGREFFHKLLDLVCHQRLAFDYKLKLCELLIDFLQKVKSLRAFEINEGFNGILWKEMWWLDLRELTGLDLFVDLFPRLNQWSEQLTPFLFFNFIVTTTVVNNLL